MIYKNIHLYFYLCILLLLITVSCQNPQKEVSFYYWKTTYASDSIIQNSLNQLHTNKLYVRIMDIDMQENGREPIPISPITFKDTLPADMQIVPVVFINTRIFQSMDSLTIRGLAHKIVPFVIEKVKQSGNTTFGELQMDCDWTASSRDKFFYLIEFMKTFPELANVELTSTLRLHQIKNIKTSGIPPVSRAILMCYNMGNLRKFGTQNSILNQEDLNLYLKDHLGNYPLKLDIALPLFEWFVVFRNQEYAGISKKIDKQELDNTTLFIRNPNTNLYVLKQDLPEKGLMKNDIIRYEFVSEEDLSKTASFLKGELKKEDRNIVFYHLDKTILSTYPNETLQKIINRL